MEDTWAAGPIELLRHAHSHMQKNSGFDRRIAFVSVDNAIELILKAYLTMPRRTRGASGLKPEEYVAIEEQFLGLLAACVRLRPDAFVEAPPLDIEHYHRIRNTLYHDGTGLTVSDEYLERYFAMGVRLLKTLMRVDFRPEVDRLTNLRPEVREALRARVHELRRREHGNAVKAGLVPARTEGRLRGRAVPVSALTDSEIALARELYGQRWGYKRIADEITRRRRQRGKPADPNGKVYEVQYQKVRRKLVDIGVVKRVGGEGYL